MVRALEQAVMAPAEPAVRSGLDGSLCDDRRFRLAGLAGGGICRRGPSHSGFSPARGSPGRSLLYALQLVLNAAWTPLFFGLRRPDLGFFDIVLVWLSIVATIVLFIPIHVGAGLLLVPYLAWVTFATALNFAVWRLNPEVVRP